MSDTTEIPTPTRQRLTPESVARSAVALADAEGLESVTVRRLAKDQGVTPMALYRHFRDKEELLDAMSDLLLEDIALPDGGVAPWDEQLREVLHALLGALRPHPNVAELTLHRILISPPGLRLAERVLGLLATAGFDPDSAAAVGTYAVCSLITLVTTEPGHDEGCADPEAHEDALRVKKAMFTALSPERYPHVVAAADALTNITNDDAYYRLGVDLVVAGIAGVSPSAARAS